MKTILSLDGGGIRGLLTARLLADLEARLLRLSGGGGLASHFDLIAGTSVGGILAAMLRVPDPDRAYAPAHEARRLPGFFHRHGPDIFRGNPIRLLGSRLRLTGYKYGRSALTYALETYLGDATLLSQVPKNLLLTGWCPHQSPGLFLLSSHEARQGPDRDCLLVEAVCATAAAPTYFEPATVRFGDGSTYELVDGGVSCGNPTLVAAHEALKMGGRPGELLVVSVGTGSFFQPARISGRAAALSAGDIIGETLRASSESVDYMTQVSAAAGSYYRFEFRLPRRVQMDDARPGTLDYLDGVAARDIEIMGNRLEACARRLIEIKKQSA